MEDGEILLVDGKEVDFETLETVEDSPENGSSEKIHNISYSVDKDNNTVNLIVERVDGKSWEWDIQSDDLVSALSIISDYEEIRGGASDLVEKLDSLASSSDSLLNEVQSMVDVPNDFYTFSADIATQIVFFLSLIFGVLVFIVFSSGLKR